MSIANQKACPVCGKELSKEIRIDNRDIIYVVCDTCGKYAMSAEFYEDYIETEKKQEKTTAFLSAHKNDTIPPFLSNQPCSIQGYKNYSALRIK